MIIDCWFWVSFLFLLRVSLDNVCSEMDNLMRFCELEFLCDYYLYLFEWWFCEWLVCCSILIVVLMYMIIVFGWFDVWGFFCVVWW